MTPQDDDVAPEDQPRAMWRFPVWKRTVVMSAGSLTHFLLAIVAAWCAAVFVGLPNPASGERRRAAKPPIRSRMRPGQAAHSAVPGGAARRWRAPRRGRAQDGD
jgi:membrane-associated protease RseP (regulator of RpoE activity)